MDNWVPTCPLLSVCNKIAITKLLEISKSISIIIYICTIRTQHHQGISTLVVLFSIMLFGLCLQAHHIKPCQYNGTPV